MAVATPGKPNRAENQRKRNKESPPLDRGNASSFECRVGEVQESSQALSRWFCLG